MQTFNVEATPRAAACRRQSLLTSCSPVSGLRGLGTRDTADGEPSQGRFNQHNHDNRAERLSLPPPSKMLDLLLSTFDAVPFTSHGVVFVLGGILCALCVLHSAKTLSRIWAAAGTAEHALRRGIYRAGADVILALIPFGIYVFVDVIIHLDMHFLVAPELSVAGAVLCGISLTTVIEVESNIRTSQASGDSEKTIFDNCKTIALFALCIGCAVQIYRAPLPGHLLVYCQTALFYFSIHNFMKSSMKERLLHASHEELEESTHL